MLDRLLKKWRSEYPRFSFPKFDPAAPHKPHTLILLESPGPGVERSGMVSMNNDDDTARELLRLSQIAFGNFARNEILVWNAIPWFLGQGGKPKMEHINNAKPIHLDLIHELNGTLKRVVFLGDWSRKLFPYYSVNAKNLQFFGGHHTGKKAQIRADLRAENELLFAAIHQGNTMSL
jgi:hypothetical protein